MSLIGLLGKGFGSAGPAPAAPLLAVVDNGDNTGAVATVGGSVSGAMNEVYVQRIGDGWGAVGDWTLGGSRIGNGAVNLAIAAGYYWVQVRSTLGGQTATSLAAWLHVTTGDDALIVEILDAVQSKIRTMGLAGVASASIVTRQFNLDAGVGKDAAIQYPVCLIAPGSTETANPMAGTNASDDYGIPVVVVLLATAANDSQKLDVETRAMLWRERLMLGFQNQRLPGVPIVSTCRVEPGRIADPMAWTGSRHKTELTFRFQARRRRGVQ